MRVPMIWGDRRSDTRTWIEGPQKELDHHIGERVVRCTALQQSVVGSTLFKGTTATSPKPSYYFLQALRRLCPLVLIQALIHEGLLAPDSRDLVAAATTLI
jgi:hypothetical protein